MNVIFPNSLTWAFNENYIYITEAEDTTSVDVSVGSNTIETALYNGSAKVYISKLLQLCFDEPRADRLKTIHLSVSTTPQSRKNARLTEVEVEWDDDEIVIYPDEPVAQVVAEKDITVVWGALEIGDRFSSYGAFHYEAEKVWQQRDVQFFVNYPFTLDLVCLKGNVLRKRSSSERTYLNVYNPIGNDAQLHLLAGHAFGHEYTVYRQDFEQPSDEGAFDMTFDHTFRTPKDTCVITKLHPRYEKEGYYLRWIDRFGFIEYYLFDAGDLSFKTAPSEYGVSAETEINGFNFEGHNHRYEIKTERSIKVCASNLDANTLEYVSSIVSSPVVDLYMGKTKEGTELWQPVHVSGGTYSYNTRHMSLRDFEITVELPNRKTQTL